MSAPSERPFPNQTPYSSFSDFEDRETWCGRRQRFVERVAERSRFILCHRVDPREEEGINAELERAILPLHEGELQGLSLRRITSSRASSAEEWPKIGRTEAISRRTSTEAARSGS